ncbi:uncharacterized protein ACA1_004860 [Acanthamoeba castellanii str. Neff]|uniref:Uncharacterized protein n=1 Tax=Acanthamoeba castellanii (strain ATCC 30010 / Neff) TaxID=1257118 RepID=L8GMD5_ACACF|nr:uncharacterized protein ACA1_004860 [Acanthamoeba castellanii str. Neff]ELR14127.1 hypothetical protein ACA1_004860 [Acanthamoeba castellanii str. Neff]
MSDSVVAGVQTRLSTSGAVVPIRQLGFISRFTKSIKKYLLQPFVVGFAVALGMSFGYSAYDAIVHRVATFWKS